MSVVRKALINLDNSLTDLEKSVDVLEQNLAGSQRDMFPETQRAVVKSLDKMITHVETVLEDA